MDGHHFLQTAVVFLLATVVAVPLTKRFRLGAVLGYLIAGVVIGPSVLGLVNDTAGVSAISDFGVVLMLFVIGLELSPSRLWVMRRSVFGSGSLQVAACGIAIGAIAYFLVGITWKASVIVGGSLALSSTAFGLQILAERKEAGTVYGRQAFAILLFQDLAAIPLIAAIPLLGGAAAHGAHGPDTVGVLRVVGTILGVIVGGRLLLRPVFRFVARAKSTEVFTATALLVVMGTAWLMELAGISTTLGAFLAGLLLADSEYRHELESNIEPFKGLLLGLFFVSVGMSVDLALLVAQPVIVLGMVVLLLVVKAVLIVPLGKLVGGLTTGDSVRLAAVLASGGEFAFVILNLAQQNQLIDDERRGLMVMAISLSMAMTPLLVLAASRLVQERVRKPDRAFDQIEADAPRVIIAGFGRMGQIVARILRAQGIQFVALESSVEQVETSRRFGGTSLFFGDPGRPEMLRAAQADKAEVFVIATDDPEANIRTARLVRRQYPNLKIVARARNRQHAFRLMDIGIEDPVRETFYSSLEMTRHVLESLDMPPEVVEARIARFQKHDSQVLRAQYLVYDDDAALVQSTKDALHDLQQLFEADAVEERVRDGER